MAASFGPETPILSYGPRAHANPGGRNEREWLFWPAWAFRVVAPEFRSRGINALQKAVLGVLRASRLTATELGECLGIHHELAAFVVTELQIRGQVDEEWAVTTHGVELLEKEHEESANFVPGWVFRDPWNGNLWPFVAPSLEYARTAQDEKGYPVLELGTTGKPWQQRAWMQMQVPLDGQRMEPPVAREVLRAALRHKRLGQRSQHLGVWEAEDLETDAVVGVELDRISSIEAEPDPVFLSSYLYVPQDGEDCDSDWYACDFFGRGSDQVLRQLVIQVAKQEQHLAGRLDRLLGRTLYYDNFDEFKRVAEKRKSMARMLRDQVLTIDVNDHNIDEPLVEILDGWLEIRDLAEAASQRHKRNVLMSCRTTLERLFSDVAKRWPLAGVADRLCRDREVNAVTLRAAANDIGLTELPEVLCRVPHGQVRSVCDYDDSWRLRPLVVATLLRARDEGSHPLRSVGKKAPDFLARIERVTKLGGEAAHGGGNEPIDLDSVDMSVRETLEIVGLLLNLPVRPIEEVMEKMRNG